MLALIIIFGVAVGVFIISERDDSVLPLSKRPQFFKDLDNLEITRHGEITSKE